MSDPMSFPDPRRLPEPLSFFALCLCAHEQPCASFHRNRRDAAIEDTPGVNQSYTMYFNRRYKTVGHLFQGWYKAILCDREAYLLGLLKYIHENPVRARITKTVDAYPWSSHAAYAGKNNPLGLVTTDRVLRMFSENKSRAWRKYLESMDREVTLGKSDVYATVDQRIQGDETFVDAITAKAEAVIKKEPEKKACSLAEIGGMIQKRHAVTLEQLRSSVKSEDVMKGRPIFSQTARRYGYRGREIAEYLRKDPASITNYLHGEENSREVDGIVRLLERINVNSKV